VNCEQAASMVGAYADGELDRLKRGWLEKHLRSCPSCAAQHADLLALRKRLRAEAPYFAAPPGLRERVLGDLARQGAVREGQRATRGWTLPLRPWTLAPLAGERWRWLGGGVVAGCAATLFAFTVGSAIVDYRVQHDLAKQAVEGHVRATLDDHLVEVASSDRHTVKPWLSARLDYSPPVRDLSADGFPLLGGRLTTLEGHAVATLVYGYRKHVIDVYVQPEAGNAPAPREVRGFHVVHARANGWDWLAVSDAEPDILEGFLHTLVRAAAQP
jgi:anti-sigma factor RsiW